MVEVLAGTAQLVLRVRLALEWVLDTAMPFLRLERRQDFADQGRRSFKMLQQHLARPELLRVGIPVRQTFTPRHRSPPGTFLDDFPLAMTFPPATWRFAACEIENCATCWTKK